MTTTNEHVLVNPADAAGISLRSTARSRYQPRRVNYLASLDCVIDEGAMRRTSSDDPRLEFLNLPWLEVFLVACD